MKKQLYPFLCLISLSLVFLSCNKEPEVVTGETQVTYESGDYLNILTNYNILIGSGGSSQLFIENADPYRDLIGTIIRSGEADGASSLTLNDLTCTEIYMDCRDEQLMATHLQDARLVVLDETSAQRNVLADMAGFDAGTKVLTFNINSGDFADFFNDFSSKEMFFEFEWDVRPQSNIDVTYRVKMDAAYTFELEK